MRYRGDPSGGRLTHLEMARKVRLERCIGGRLQLGAKNGGRVHIKGPSPVRERAASDYGPVGSRRPQPPRVIAPPPIRMPFNPPLLRPLRRVEVDEAEEDEVGVELSGPSSRKDHHSLILEGCRGCCSHQGP
jgi:hypothetical protein